MASAEIHRGLTSGKCFQVDKSTQEHIPTAEAFLPDERYEHEGCYLTSVFFHSNGEGLAALRAAGAQLWVQGIATLDSDAVAGGTRGICRLVPSPPDHHADIRFPAKLAPTRRRLLAGGIAAQSRYQPPEIVRRASAEPAGG